MKGEGPLQIRGHGRFDALLSLSFRGCAHSASRSGFELFVREVAIRDVKVSCKLYSVGYIGVARPEAEFGVHGDLAGHDRWICSDAEFEQIFDRGAPEQDSSSISCLRGFFTRTILPFAVTRS